MIKITEFALRHFDKNFGGTKILDMSPEEFEKIVNECVETGIANKIIGDYVQIIERHDFIDGYAPFCKLLPIINFTDARLGSMPITLENYQYLRSGYSARTESELPVFSRWLELPLSKPKAKYLMLVLYSKEQIDKEAGNNEFDADWGIVAVLGQSHPNEEPMKPETMIRNALGISEGGSGVPLDRKAYLKSVDFWENNATVK